MKTKRLLIIILPCLLAFGLATVALAAAYQSIPEIRSEQKTLSGELQAGDHTIAYKTQNLPHAADAQVDAQGIMVLPESQVQEGAVAINPQSLQPGFTVDMAYDSVMGFVNPGDQVTVSVGTAFGSAVADASGFFWTPIWEASGYPLHLSGGQSVFIYVNGSLADTVMPVNISGGVNILTDQVSGILHGLDTGIPVTVTVGRGGTQPEYGEPSVVAITTAGGVFSTTFASIDLTGVNNAQVDYKASGLSHVRNYLRPEPATLVIDNFEQVVGFVLTGGTVTVTVYITYPTDIRWQGASISNRLGFYKVSGVDSQVGDIVEVYLGISNSITTTVASLHDITFDADADQVSGTAPEGQDVLVYYIRWLNGAQSYQEMHVTSGPGDTFSADFAADLRASDAMSVYLTDENGHSTAISGGAPYIEAWIDPESAEDCVTGRVEAPNQPITLSIQTASSAYTSTLTTRLSGAGNEILPQGSCYVIRGPTWGPINFSAGDVITLQSPNWSGNLTIAEVSWQADTDVDQITGSAPDGEVRLDATRWYGDLYPARGTAVRVAPATAGSFTADFSSFDLRDMDNVYVRYYDPISDFVTEFAGADYAGTRIHFFIVDAPWGVSGRVNTPNENVTASLYDENSVWLASASGNANPWEFWLTDLQEIPFSPGYWITVTGTSGWTAGFQIPLLTVEADEVTNIIWGQGPTDRLFLETNRGLKRILPTNGSIFKLLHPALDLLWGDGLKVYYTSPSGNQLVQTKHWPHLVAQYGPYTTGNRVWGNEANLLASLPITVTDPGGTVIATTTVQADLYGNFDTSNLPQDSIAPGNIITVNFGESGPEGVEVLPITGEANSTTEVVTVSASVGTPVSLSADGPNGWWDSSQSYPSMVIGPGGYATFDLSVDGYDIVPSTYFNIQTEQYHGHSTEYTFQYPVLNIRTNYGHDWVEGNFDSGHTIWITVTNSTGTILATATGVTGPIPGWGGISGFSTNYNVLWQGLQPDLQSGDWIYARLDDGQTSASRLGTINATSNVNSDIVAGTINAPWYSETLTGACSVWEDGGPGMGFNINPNGGAFTCDFSGLWDIIPGHTIGVSYNEPDGDQVINIASNPAPSLHINTWGDGQPASGSNFMFYVQYRNDGDAPTQNAIISAVLEGGLTYLDDTSGLQVSGSGTPGDPLVWQLGTLPPAQYTDTRFYLFTQVTAAVGDWVTNTVQIDNGTPYDQDDPEGKFSQWSGQVYDDNVDINIGKNAWTWDPVPGSQFVYILNVCNNGSTGSAEVIVTDTLPLSTTLVSWWGQQLGWEEISSSPHELVVSRLTASTGWCGEIYLRVQLDASAWAGMPLHNVAYVFSNNDLSPDNNQAEIWHYVGIPHKNLGIHKEWSWGELVAGGEIHYNINYYNDGNLPVEEVRITETLPASTTFTAAFWYDDTGGHPFTPTLVTEEIAAWEIGSLDNGYGQSFEVILNIDPQAPPGLELVNTADITRLPGEDRYDDNTSTWTETIFGHGPNLRVSKTGDWHSAGNGHTAWYNLTVENVGDTTVEHVTVTDTLPVSMTLDGDPNMDWSQVEAYVRNDAEGWFSITFSSLQPGWRRDILMNVVNPSPEPVPGGQFFTNRAEVMQVAGETSYTDNTTEYTLASGPDLFVEKSLLAGEIRPGEVVTFSLLFGNQQVGHAWWWDLQGTAWLTDVLPTGTEFITATQRWCDETFWCPAPPDVEGDTLVWHLGPIGGGQWNEFYVTVRLTDTLSDLDTLVNQATIFSDRPDLDIEPDYTNNTAVYQHTLTLPSFQVEKGYTGNTVAGTLVTYTLTVSNSGTSDGSGVAVSDQLPTNLTYISGGSYNTGTGEVTWMLPFVASGDSAEVEFAGQLTCEAGLEVLNDAYRVTSSNEGITSDWGAPVAFTVVTPTIETSFEPSDLTVIEAEMVYFTGTAVTDGTSLTYAWDFGGDGAAAGLSASHAFSAAGSYTVTLTVTDGCGYTAEYSLTVEVAEAIQRVYLPLVRK